VTLRRPRLRLEWRRHWQLSNSRGPDTLAGVVASISGSVRAGTVPEAARFGRVAAIAIPPRALRELPPEPFAGKIVVDATNHYPDHDGRFPELDGSDISSSAALASLLPRARVVKAFNTLYFRRNRNRIAARRAPRRRLTDDDRRGTRWSSSRQTNIRRSGSGQAPTRVLTGAMSRPTRHSGMHEREEISMSDETVSARIERLVDEEHTLRTREQSDSTIDPWPAAPTSTP
jgi:hypothetical protein